MRRGAGSQWIVAASPLCHLQCLVAYLSHLQRIQPAAHEEGSFEAACHGTSAGVTPRPTDSTGEFENLSDEAEELCYNSFFPDLCNTYLEFFSLP